MGGVLRAGSGWGKNQQGLAIFCWIFSSLWEGVWGLVLGCLRELWNELSCFGLVVFEIRVSLSLFFFLFFVVFWWMYELELREFHSRHNIPTDGSLLEVSIEVDGSYEYLIANISIFFSL